MNPKLKKIIAIIGLIFMGLFTVSFIVFLVDPTALYGRILYLALLTFGVGLLMFLIIYFNNGFPSQQNKAQEMQKLKEEYLKKQEESQLENPEENHKDNS